MCVELPRRLPAQNRAGGEGADLARPRRPPGQEFRYVGPFRQPTALRPPGRLAGRACWTGRRERHGQDRFLVFVAIHGRPRASREPASKGWIRQRHHVHLATIDRRHSGDPAPAVDPRGQARARRSAGSQARSQVAPPPRGLSRPRAPVMLTERATGCWHLSQRHAPHHNGVHGFLRLYSTRLRVLGQQRVTEYYGV